MKLNADGTTVAFDSLQTFEIGMMDGCVLGKLSKAGTDTNYFHGVTQPFYFVADSSADSGVVSIRVGVIDMNPQNRILNNNNPIENDNPVSCANLDFIENLYINANLVVGDGWCDDLDECDEPTEFPEIDWDDHRNGFEVTDEKTLQKTKVNVCLPEFISGSAFIGSGFKEFIEYDEIEICLNTETNRIQFKYGDDNEITINWVWDFCPDYINSIGIIRARDIYSIPGSIQPFCYEIINSLELQKIYPAPLGQGDYLFEDIWIMHENGHQKILEQSLNKFKPAYLEKMKSLEKACKDFANEAEANNFYTKEAEELIKTFYNAGINNENRQNIRFDPGLPIRDLQPWRELEDVVHKPVIEYIKELIKLVKYSEIGCR